MKPRANTRRASPPIAEDQEARFDDLAPASGVTRLGQPGVVQKSSKVDLAVPTRQDNAYFGSVRPEHSDPTGPLSGARCSGVIPTKADRGPGATRSFGTCTSA